MSLIIDTDEANDVLSPRSTARHMRLFHGLLQSGDQFQKAATRQDIEKYRHEHYNQLSVVGTVQDRSVVQDLALYMNGVYDPGCAIKHTGDVIAQVPVIPMASIDDVRNRLKRRESSSYIYTCSVDDVEDDMAQLEREYL